MSGHAVGSRELSRRETRRAIQHAALVLAVEHGIDAFTVEDVCARAHVSRRTFFNYFASKEAAFAGRPSSLLEVAEEIGFVRGGPSGDLFDDLCELFIRESAAVADEPALHDLRRVLLRANPHLIGLSFGTVREFEDAVVALVSRRAGTEREADAVHVLTTMVAVAAVRHAARGWAEVPADASLPARIRRSFALTRATLASASTPDTARIAHANTAPRAQFPPFA